jgi:predicted ArsR family transcriptional regulator
MGETDKGNIFKALSTPARRRVLDLIQRDGPMDLKRLTEASGMKETTLRHHLLVLERAGLVASEEGHEGVPGRPPLVYSVPRKHHEIGFPKRQYALLSEHLLQMLISIEGQETAARLMGEMGEKVASGILGDIASRKGNDLFEIEDIQRYLVPILDEMGGAVTVDELSDSAVSIRMNNCIFFELSKVYPDLICEGHRALFAAIGRKLGGFSAQVGTCLAHDDQCCVTHLVKKESDVS